MYIQYINTYEGLWYLHIINWWVHDIMDTINLGVYHMFPHNISQCETGLQVSGQLSVGFFLLLFECLINLAAMVIGLSSLYFFLVHMRWWFLHPKYNCWIVLPSPTLNLSKVNLPLHICIINVPMLLPHYRSNISHHQGFSFLLVPFLLQFCSQVSYTECIS